MTFEEGDILKVMEKNASGWWIAEVPNGDQGWVPGSFLEKLSGGPECEESINVDGKTFPKLRVVIHRLRQPQKMPKYHAAFDH